MIDVYKQKDSLNSRISQQFEMHKEILVEHAASNIAFKIKNKIHQKAVISILCGGGDNGAVGYALARLLQDFFTIWIFEVSEPKSELA